MALENKSPDVLFLYHDEPLDGDIDLFGVMALWDIVFVITALRPYPSFKKKKKKKTPSFPKKTRWFFHVLLSPCSASALARRLAEAEKPGLKYFAKRGWRNERKITWAPLSDEI
jgi:hypothetical protein